MTLKTRLVLAAIRGLKRAIRAEKRLVRALKRRLPVEPPPPIGRWPGLRVVLDPRMPKDTVLLVNNGDVSAICGLKVYEDKTYCEAPPDPADAPTHYVHVQEGKRNGDAI